MNCIVKNFHPGSFLLLLFLAIIAFDGNAQYASRELSKKQRDYIDSLKQVEYDYLLPVWGQQAYKKGFDIPYPVGAMGNYIWMDQGILIENFQLGIRNDNANIPLTPIDFIEFGENRNTSYAVNFRPDVWVFPFLNVYGLFGYGSSTTEVNLVKPVMLKSIVTQQIATKGFGVMSGFGLGKYWMSVDANWTWTKPELLEDAVLAKVLGVRLGRTFPFASNPERNVAFWVGGMRARMSSETVGAVLMEEAIPQETWDRLDEIEDDWNAFLEDHPNLEGGAFDTFIKSLTSRDGSTIIDYAMDKAPEQEWNVLFGGQFQLNKRWQFRSEAGLIGDRKSFLFSVNYRFLL